MARFQESIVVNAPIQVCYQQWMRFEEFPRFMKHVKSVTRQGDQRWHWVVDGPLGQTVEWDAKIDGSEADRIISWHSISDPDVGVQGAVLFEPIRTDATRLVLTLQFQPLGGALGELVGNIFSNPQEMAREDLRNFKQLIESKEYSSASV